VHIYHPVLFDLEVAELAPRSDNFAHEVPMLCPIKMVTPVATSALSHPLRAWAKVHRSTKPLGKDTRFFIPCVRCCLQRLIGDFVDEEIVLVELDGHVILFHRFTALSHSRLSLDDPSSIR
jgi:hypothetical protein